MLMSKAGHQFAQVLRYGVWRTLPTTHSLGEPYNPGYPVIAMDFAIPFFSIRPRAIWRLTAFEGPRANGEQVSKWDGCYER